MLMIVRHEVGANQLEWLFEDSYAIQMMPMEGIPQNTNKPKELK